jgi:hypothetical protein
VCVRDRRAGEAAQAPRLAGLTRHMSARVGVEGGWRMANGERGTPQPPGGAVLPGSALPVAELFAYLDPPAAP